MKIEVDIEISAPGATASARDWRMRIYPGPSYIGGVSYSADVFRGDHLLCRLVYAGAHIEAADAHAALAARALTWVESYKARRGKLLC